MNAHPDGLPGPLRTPVFHILLALASGPLHGLGIAEEAETATAGAVELPPGTLYRCLKEMVRRGLVVEVEPPEPDADPRRKYYGLTPLGRRTLEAEAARLRDIVELARDRAVLPETV